MIRPLTGPDGDNPISDEQIRELERTVRNLRTRAFCGTALRIARGRRHIEARRRARTHCAEVWNARHPETPGDAEIVRGCGSCADEED